jgi:hypothetical protein
VTGRGEKPEIAFTSTPALPQDESNSPDISGSQDVWNNRTADENAEAEYTQVDEQE